MLRVRVGAEPGRWKPVYLDFVRIWLATVLVFILCAALIALLVSAAAGGAVALAAAVVSKAAFGLWLFIAIVLGFAAVLLALVLASAPARAYREARLFHLMWNNIGVSRIARFKCDLRARPYVFLRLRNMLLTLLTLGFFRPFALVSEYRMKLESVTLHVKGGVDQVAGRLERLQQDGIGDALADAAGLDLIG